MDKKFLRDISPLTKDKFAWDAFIALLDHQKEELLIRLKTHVDVDELLKINGQFILIEKLSRTKEYTDREQH